MFINRNKCRPCFECKGLGKKDDEVCKLCEGYGSIGLKILEQSRASTNSK